MSVDKKNTLYNALFEGSNDNIVNIDAETATIETVAGVINTLLVNLRTAGIIQM